MSPIPPFPRSAFLYDEALGELFREHPEVEQEIYESSARIFEILAAAAREHARKARR